MKFSHLLGFEPEGGRREVAAGTNLRAACFCRTAVSLFGHRSCGCKELIVSRRLGPSASPS